MSLKMDFVEKASRPGARVSELCREYGISRETGYKWLNRFKREGYDGLEERSRAPHSSPLMKAEEPSAPKIFPSSIASLRVTFRGMSSRCWSS